MRAAGTEGVALLDAEPVLFIDDDQAQLGEPHPVLDQRVGADDDARLTGLRIQHRLPLRLRAQRSREQRDPGGDLRGTQLARLAQRAEQRAQRTGVLSREHLGGREHRGLPARIHRLQHRPQRHDRLARAHIALHEPVHGMPPCEVGGDLLAHRALPGRERERQPGVERLQQAPRPRRAGRGGPCGGGPAPQRERELHPHRLVPHQAVAGGVDVDLALGHVDAA